MSTGTQPSTPIYSFLADDPDLHDIVKMFVDEMPSRINQLLDEFVSKNWDELQKITHQLKGTIGSYGFSEITPAVGKLEQSLKAKLPEEEIQQSLVELIDLCRRMTIKPH
ncbi:MAG: Hpt domain-containing protein [Planctomycetaceae bacterium]|nr:Hpt domain-containing protein [Planctomycetaceae bacterium]